MTQKLTLPIQVGKKYVRRDGAVVTVTNGYDSLVVGVGGGNSVWAENGQVYRYRQGIEPTDLVADFVEESPKKPKKPAAKQPAKEAKVYTLEQFLQATDDTSGYDLRHYSKAIQEQLDKITDPEYIEYLRLKQKFEN